MPIARRLTARIPSPFHSEPLEPRVLFSGGFVFDHTPSFASGVASADFDGDGDLDVATTAGSSDPTGLRILINQAGELVETQMFPYLVTDELPLNIAVADFDNDGDVDILALGLRLFRNNAGTFGAAEILAPERTHGSYFLVDEDGDDLPDIFVQNANTLEVRRYRNIGGVSIGAPDILDPVDVSVLHAVTDVDGDSDPDLVYYRYFDSHISVYKGDSGAYTYSGSIEFGADSVPIVADVNGDSLPDLLWAQGQVAVAINFGSGSPVDVVYSGSDHWHQVLDVGDFDADGFVDIVGLYDAGSQPAIGVAFAEQPGIFGHSTAKVVEYFPQIEHDPFVHAGLITADAREDAMVVRRFRGTPDAGALEIYRSVTAPTVSAIHASSDPIIPGRFWQFDVTAVSAEAGNVFSVRIYRDANDNGLLDELDPLFAEAEHAHGQTWTVNTLLPDGLQAGHTRFFAVAATATEIQSDAAPFLADVWTRIAYPEGWRNDDTINEYLPIVNPNPFPVTYRLIAHYETGERDEVIAEGTIAPFTRGGVTISEFANPDASLVRLNEGYALELQSDAFLGATFSHYDSFTGVAGERTATGEALTNQFAGAWHFADVYTGDIAFLVYFNPSDQAVDLSISIYDSESSFTTITRSLDPLRRGGVSLADLNLPQNAHFAISIASDAPILAALSSYSTQEEDGAGFTTLGRLGSAVGFTDLPLVELRDGTRTTLTLFNVDPTYADAATISLIFDVLGDPVVRSFGLDPHERRVIDIDDIRPEGAASVTIRLDAATTYAFVDTNDSIRGDSLAATPGVSAFNTWAFADGFLDRSTAGSVGFETLSLFNPNAHDIDGTVHFLFTDGTVAEKQVTITAGRTLSLQLDQEDLILDHAQLNFYSIVVHADNPIIASMIHWDLFQQGGWATLGTPGTSAGPV